MYKYRITIEALNQISRDNETIPSLSFNVANHDDLFHIVEVVRSKKLVDLDKAAALAIGLKLLSEIVLEKRRDPLFAFLFDPLRNFVQQLKTIPPTLTIAQSVKDLIAPPEPSSAVFCRKVWRAVRAL